MPTDDHHLIVDLIAGVPSAFERIFQAEWASCMRIACALLGADYQKAMDVVQESFIKLWDNRHKLDEEQGYRYWLYRCVRNQAIDWLRKKTPTYLSGDFEQSLMVAPPAAASDESLIQGVYSLGPKHREVILLRYWQGLSIKEIAQILQIPTGTVGSRLAIGLQKLKNYLYQRQRQGEEYES